MLIFYHLRGIVSHCALAYPFLSQKEIEIAIDCPILSGDQAFEGQREYTTTTEDVEEDDARVGTRDNGVATTIGGNDMIK